MMRGRIPYCAVGSQVWFRPEGNEVLTSIKYPTRINIRWDESHFPAEWLISFTNTFLHESLLLLVEYLLIKVLSRNIILTMLLSRNMCHEVFPSNSMTIIHPQRFCFMGAFLTKVRDYGIPSPGISSVQGMELYMVINVGPMVDHVGPMRDHVGPMRDHVEPMRGPLGTGWRPRGIVHGPCGITWDPFGIA